VADLSLTKNKPADVAQANLVAEVLRLRAAGLSYRRIGERVDRSHVRCKVIVDEAMREVAEHSFQKAGALLGMELERLDGLVRSASAILLSSTSSNAEKLRAVREIRACGEARVRWLGLSAPERIELDVMSRTELHRGELAGLTGAALDKELRALGVRFVDESAPG
jgi:hypothetical protein